MLEANDALLQQKARIQDEINTSRTLTKKAKQTINAFSHTVHQLLDAAGILPNPPTTVAINDTLKKWWSEYRARVPPAMPYASYNSGVASIIDQIVEDAKGLLETKDRDVETLSGYEENLRTASETLAATETALSDFMAKRMLFAARIRERLDTYFRDKAACSPSSYPSSKDRELSDNLADDIQEELNTRKRMDKKVAILEAERDEALKGKEDAAAKIEGWRNHISSTQERIDAFPANVRLALNEYSLG